MIYINASNACCALGRNNAEIMANAAIGSSPGLKFTPGYLVSGQSVYLGHAAVSEDELEAAAKLHAQGALPPFHNSRNNRLLWFTWQPLAAVYQELCATLQLKPERIAVLMGTSTSGGAEIDRKVSTMLQEPPLSQSESPQSQLLQSGPLQTEHYQSGLPQSEMPSEPEFYFAQQELGDIAAFMHEALHLPPHPLSYSISTACSSTLRAMISGVRMLQAGLCDLAIVGGCDTLNREVVNGFNALSLVSQERLCCPFGAQRSGITIGEAAGIMLLSRERLDAKVAIVGLGASSDAHHMSAPHPQGAGARQAIQQALHEAQLQAQDIGYINLHGTGTKLNDAVEAQVISQIFGAHVPCSSTKYLTGHTLGACGILESILSAQILEQSLTRKVTLIKQDFQDQGCDPGLPDLHFCDGTETLASPYILNNAFAFGGNNAAVVLKQLND